MVGVWWMLAWMGASAVWQRPQLLGAGKPDGQLLLWQRGDSPGIGVSTVSGLALYVLVYSLLARGFAMRWAGRLPRPRLALASIAFALCWYYVAFHLVAKAVSPLVVLLDTERTTFLGHALYGVRWRVSRCTCRAPRFRRLRACWRTEPPPEPNR